MHALIAGIGSIGVRHARILKTLGVTRIDAYRTGKGVLEVEAGLISNTYKDLDQALNQKPSFCICANPTSLHYDTALACVEKGISVLIEKPLSNKSQGFERLTDLSSQQGCVVQVAFNMRWHKLLRKIRKVLTEGCIGSVRTARFHFGSFMPEWHPWEDFRNSYVTRRDLGGGALLTHSHELDMAMFLLGHWSSFKKFKGARSNIGLSVDEYAAVILEHQCGAISSITLDLFQKRPERSIVIVGDKGRLEADILNGTIVIDSELVQQKHDSSDPSGLINDSYVSQDRYFLRQCKVLSSSIRHLEEVMMIQHVIGF